MSGFHPEGIIWGGGGLQEMGVALYAFLYNFPKFWGESLSPPPPPDETLDVYIISSSSNELFLDFHYVVDNDI